MPCCTRGTSSTLTGRRSRTASAGPSAASIPRPTAGHGRRRRLGATRPSASSAATPATTFEAVVRFLHLTARQVGDVDPPLAEWPDGDGAAVPPRRVAAGRRPASSRPGRRRRSARSSSARRPWASCSARPAYAGPSRSRAAGGRSRCSGRTGRSSASWSASRSDVEGDVEVSAVEVGEGLYRLTLRVVEPDARWRRRADRRDEALLRSPGLDARDPRRRAGRVRLAARPARPLARGRRRVPERRRPGRSWSARRGRRT